MDIQIKIREYIKYNKMSFREFAKLAGLPNSTLQSICERGIGSASFLNASKIAKVLGVSLSDFETFNGDFSASDSEQNMILKYRSIDSRGKQSVDAVLLHEFARVETFAVKDAPAAYSFDKKKANYINIEKRAPKLSTVKIFLQPAAAGYGNYLDDEYFEELELENVPASADFGVRIAGDSMQPKICDGDIAFVKKQETIQEGEIGIYIIDGDAFCKKLIKKQGEFYLHSLNEKYDDFILPQNAYVVGKVVQI
ncbi:MAG: XRE family transcriptional regulator [Bacillota bacterium]